MYRFLVSGVSLSPYRLSDGREIVPGGQMKSQARRVSHRLPGADDKVGPVIRFERYGRVHERPLTRREMIFGVKAPPDGKGGGFAGLVIWRDPYEDRPGEVIITPRARLTGAGEWIVQFVRQIILTAGWTIIKEEPMGSSRY